MATPPGPSILLVVAGLTVIHSQGEDCPTIRNNVSLMLNVSNICPEEAVTAYCIVSQPSDPLILWQCSGLSGERIVLCNNPAEFTCQFGKVQNLTGQCSCGDTIATSNVSFYTPPIGDDIMTLNCSDGKQEEYVTVSTNGLEPIKLNYINRSLGNDIHRVQLWWEFVDSTTLYTDLQYNVLINSSVAEIKNLTKMRNTSFNMLADVQYYISVTAHRCNGKLTRTAEISLCIGDCTGDISMGTTEPLSTAPSNSDKVVIIVVSVLLGFFFLLAVVLSFVVIWLVKVKNTLIKKASNRFLTNRFSY